MKRLTFLIAAFAFTFLFSGCGQSGPLYIPGNPSQMAVPPSQPPPSEEESEEKSEEESLEDSGESSETD
jgi:predicted small lipoprotein YifL